MEKTQEPKKGKPKDYDENKEEQTDEYDEFISEERTANAGPEEKVSLTDHLDSEVLDKD